MEYEKRSANQIQRESERTLELEHLSGIQHDSSVRRELLDQLYQYGQAENIGVGNLCELNYREEEIPSLDECI